MREIKFRAWDKEAKELTEDIYFHEFCNVTDSFANAEVDGYEFAQYTGLKDKNGVEIYEGDIFIINTNKHKGEIYKIVEDELSTGFKGEHVKSFINVFLNSQRNMFYEVIGNIYENKELLEKEADE